MVTTVDATVTQVASTAFSLPPASGGMVEIRVTVFKASTNQSCSWCVLSAFSVPAFIGSPTFSAPVNVGGGGASAPFGPGAGALAACAIGLVSSSGKLVVKVTGIAATTLQWSIACNWLVGP